ELGVHRGEGRRTGRGGADTAGLQPGVPAYERAPAADRLGQVPLVPAQDRSGAGVRARGQARVPAHRRGGSALRAPLGGRRAHPAGPRRDRLDARIEQADEPRDGADGGQDRPHLPGLRADALNMTGRAVTMSRQMTESESPIGGAAPADPLLSESPEADVTEVEGSAAGSVVDEPERAATDPVVDEPRRAATDPVVDEPEVEIVDGLPVLAEVRTVERAAPAALP